MPHLSLPRPGACIGIDLAGLPRRETGIAVLRAGRLELLTTAGDDDAIMTFVALAGGNGTIAINAPLSLPRGRCCLDVTVQVSASLNEALEFGIGKGKGDLCDDRV